MREHVRLLDHLIRMWNPNEQYFEVGGHILTLEVEEIYFLTRLSMRGVPISLADPRRGDITTKGLIFQFANPIIMPTTRIYSPSLSHLMYY